jgi:hypothetical protein
MFILHYGFGFFMSFYFVNSFLSNIDNNNIKIHNKSLLSIIRLKKFDFSDFDKVDKVDKYSLTGKNKRNYEVIDIDGKSNIWANDPKIEIMNNVNYLNSKNWAIFLIMLAFISITLTFLNANSENIINSY